MSILDPVQKILAPDIWDASNENKMFPSIKKDILDNLFTFLDPVNVREIFVIGTIVGYQYKNTSDIDCNIVVDPPELASDIIKHQDLKKHNGNIATGTKHPINYFLVGWKGDYTNWGDHKFGVYDLLKDVWVISPGNSEDIKDPNLEFGLEINLTKLYIKKFSNLVSNWETHLEQLFWIQNRTDKTWYEQDLLKKKAQLKADFEALVEFCHDIDRDRKLEYYYNWGTPRRNWRNILFKSLEGTKLEHYFEFFKEIKVNDYYTIYRDIINSPIQDKEAVVSYRANRQLNNLLPDINKP